MIDRLLQSHLEPIARGCRRWLLWRGLAQCWGVLALAGLAFILLRHYTDWFSPLVFFALAAGAVFGAGLVIRNHGRTKVDYQAVARQVEEQNPELHALLLTAVEQVPQSPAGELNYLQQRVISEALLQYRKSDWGRSLMRRNSRTRLAHLGALAAFALVLVALRPPIPSLHGNLWTGAERSHGVTVTPGDTTIERGTVLAVFARFDGRLPVEARLVINTPNESERTSPLAKNLGDPVYAGVVSEIKHDLTYHIEYPSGRTRDFKVTVFDYPKLERADAKVTYPTYTGLPEKTIKDTRRVSAVEGSALDYSFFLNKPVTSAKLVAKDKSVVPLTTDATNTSVYHTKFTLDTNKRYELLLTDSAGRTNRMPPEFVLEALKNRPAELKLASPRGDQRVSAIEEVAFAGETSADYGLRSFGLAYTVAGGETKNIELGQKTAPREKRQFNYVLPLETLGVQPDQLVSYYLWADDTGPDGQVRRNTSDMYFAEIRPFEEVFRENQTPEQPGGEQANNNGGRQGQGGNPRDRLSDLQKQIITATWNLKRRESDSKPSEKFKPDLTVIHDSQQQALEQLQTMKEGNEDPKLATFIETAEKNMEEALKNLAEAGEKNSTTTLPPALTGEQAAYQALLKLSAREFQVARSSRGQRGGGQQQRGGQRMQRQLDQLDLAQRNSNRYETQRQANAQQQNTPEQREQLQVANRLKELAQRQQDLNDRLRELQAALQEARTEQEKQDIRDRLKRLREEQQDLLADTDELRQRMDRPENQSQMSQERQQLDQTRSEIQNAAESLNRQDGVSQALASGTRAQRELQQLQEDFRKKNSGQFSEAMRQMRDDARQLAQNQEDVNKKLNDLADPKQKTLSETDEQKKDRQALADKLAQQKQGLTNLLNQMRDVSEQSETAEPLLSQQLYDSLRQVGGQDEMDKTLDQSSELVRRGFFPQATQVEEPTRKKIDDLKQGVERAAENILGDGTEALRLARRELEDLKRELDAELARSGSGGTNSTNFTTSTGWDTNSLQQRLGFGGTNGTNFAEGDAERRLIERRQAEQARGGRAGQRGEGQQPGDEPGNQQANAGDRQGGQRDGQRGGGGNREGQPQEGQQPGEQAGNQPAGGRQGGQRDGQRGGGGNREGQPQDGQFAAGNREGQPQDAQAGGGNRAGGRRDGGRIGGARDFSSQNGGGGDIWGGGYWDPILGEGYVDWSDRLRAVEEMIDVPELRTEVMRIRDRARALRLDYKKAGKKPDWAVVQTQISRPLAEVRVRVDEELLKRQSKDALVPLDRDPVPSKFSELVRRYYEQLGKNND